MDHKQTAFNKYLSGYNCAQALACAYAKDIGMDEEQVFRFMQGFGKGMGHVGHTCGACSAMVSIASYVLCKGMENPQESKEKTYPVIKKMVERFKKENEYLNCFDILKYTEGGIQQGKRKSCIRCIESASEQLDACIQEVKV